MRDCCAQCVLQPSDEQFQLHLGACACFSMLFFSLSLPFSCLGRLPSNPVTSHNFHPVFDNIFRTHASLHNEILAYSSAHCMHSFGAVAVVYLLNI